LCWDRSNNDPEYLAAALEDALEDDIDQLNEEDYEAVENLIETLYTTRSFGDNSPAEIHELIGELAFGSNEPVDVSRDDALAYAQDQIDRAWDEVEFVAANPNVTDEEFTYHMNHLTLCDRLMENPDTTVEQLMHVAEKVKKKRRRFRPKKFKAKAKAKFGKAKTKAKAGFRKGKQRGQEAILKGRGAAAGFKKRRLSRKASRRKAKTERSESKAASFEAERAGTSKLRFLKRRRLRKKAERARGKAAVRKEKTARSTKKAAKAAKREAAFKGRADAVRRRREGGMSDKPPPVPARPQVNGSVEAYAFVEGLGFQAVVRTMLYAPGGRKSVLKNIRAGRYSPEQLEDIATVARAMARQTFSKTRAQKWDELADAANIKKY
jgi:hypothetical protein